MFSPLGTILENDKFQKSFRESVLTDLMVKNKHETNHEDFVFRHYEVSNQKLFENLKQQPNLYKYFYLNYKKFV